MEKNPYHVRLSISQYGERYKAELFTEDLGDTEGAFLAADWQVMEEWLTNLSNGAAHLSSEFARRVGRSLFGFLLRGAENSKKWTEIVERATRQNRTLRVLIDAPTDQVRDLPYGLMCEPHDNYFLFRSASGLYRPHIQFVRILRRCTPKLLDLTRSPLRVLLVASEPVSENLLHFSAGRRLRDLARSLSSKFEVYAISVNGLELLNPRGAELRADSDIDYQSFCFVRPEELRDALTDHDFDILHVIAHGLDGELLLCDTSRREVVVTPSQLGEWCGRTRLQMAFLQVCEGAKTSHRGGFGGLAQQLINPKYGNLAAVVASSYPLDASGSTSAAITFYDGIAKGYGPDVALQRDLEEHNWSWALLELWVRPSALTGVSNRGAFQFLSPYRGLARFEERNSDIFFGRNAEIAELIRIIEDESIVALAGDTGSGKSSLLQAGIASIVREKGLLGRSEWEILTIEPGGSLKERLEAGLQPRSEVSEDPSLNKIAELLDQKREAGRPLLLIVDQFEEVFTLREREVELHELCDLLGSFAVKHPNFFKLVLGIRTEYLASAITLRGISKGISRPFVLSPPVAIDLENIVLEPARQYGYAFENTQPGSNHKNESSLLRRILSDPILIGFTDQQVRTDGVPTVNPLPLLEFALERLWLLSIRRGSQEFKHEDYENMGGLGGAIVSHAEDVYSKLPTILGPSAQATCRHILTALVTSSGTRQPRTRAELEASSHEKQLTNEVINYLVGERLLAIRSNPDKLNLNYVDLIHEVLIERWDRFKSWLAENPSLRALIESFETDASKWSKWNSESASVARRALPSPAQAQQYILWIDAAKPSLTAEREQFALNLRMMLRRRKVARGVMALSATAVLIVATILILKVVNQQRETRLNLARNLQQRALVAAYNNEMMDAEVFASKALTVEDDLEQQRQIRELLLDVRAKSATRESRIEFQGRLLYADWEDHLLLTSLDRTLRLHRFRHESNSPAQLETVNTFDTGDDYIKYATISDGGQWLAYGTSTGMFKILNVYTRQLEFQDHFEPGDEKNPPISSLVFSNSGKKVAYSSESGPIRIFDLIAHRTETLSAHKEPVHKMAFSQDDVLLVAVSSDDTLTVWDILQGIQKRRLSGHSDVISSVAISVDNQRIASGSADGTVKIWDANKDTAIHTLSGSAGDLTVLSFSPDKRMLAAAAEDKTIRLFDLLTNREILKINNFDGEAKFLSFNSNSQQLFVASDRALSFWTVVKNKEVRTLIDNGQSLTSVAFSPDGEHLAAAGQDSYIHIWNFKTMRQVAYLKAADRGRINSVAFSHDGKMLAAGAEVFDANDSPLKVWEIKDDHTYERLSFTDAKQCLRGRGIQGVIFSPTQPILATAGGYNANIGLWDLRTKKCEAVAFHPNKEPVWDVVFSPDGQYLASAGDDRNVRLGKLSDVWMGQFPARLYSHTNGVWGVGFSPVQPLLASASVDRFVRVRNLNDSSEYSLPGETDSSHTAGVVDVTFDPKGIWLVSASENNLVVMWNLATRRPLLLRMHNGPVWSVTFSDNGRWLASCALDGKIEVWDTDEINSIYNSRPQVLLEQSQKQTGLKFDEHTHALVLLN